MLVSNIGDDAVSGRVEIVGEATPDVATVGQPAVGLAGGSEFESDTISVGTPVVGEAEFSVTVVESPIAFEGRRGFAGAFASF